jgi:hypothetical protein
MPSDQVTCCLWPFATDIAVLDWQGMTWDQFSNFEEEDLRAIIAYVRLLPPVNRMVPGPRPPAADDCQTYTFYVDNSINQAVAEADVCQPRSRRRFVPKNQPYLCGKESRRRQSCR